MKRFLSIILCLALVLPGTGAWAQTDEPDTAPTEELQPLSEVEALEPIGEDGGFSLEPMVDTPNGYFEIIKRGVPVEGERLYDYSQNFEDENNLITQITTVYGYDDKLDYLNEYAGPKEGVWPIVYGSDACPFEPDGSNRYITVRQTAAKKASNSVNVHTSPRISIRGMTDNEKVHISFYMKNNDFIYDKTAYYSAGHRTATGITFAKMGRDGKLTLGYNKTGAISVDYSLNRWYKIDVVLKALAGGNDAVDIYLDGKKMTTISYTDIMNVTNGNGGHGAPEIVHFMVACNGVTYSGTDDSVLCIDNIYMQYYGENDGEPVITPNQYAYTNFDMHPSACGTDGFVGDSTSTVLDYSVDSAVFGKVSGDRSMKLVTDEAVASNTPDGTVTDDAYVFDISNIKSGGSTFAPGSQLKYSFSYAYKELSGAAAGGDILQLKDSSDNAVDLLSISRAGVVSAGGATRSLISEQWYNFDVILTTDTDSTMKYDIYINGKDCISGDVADSFGADIAKICLKSEMANGYRAESHLDDMYIKYFAATEAVPNEAIQKDPAATDIDLGTNGKITVTAKYKIPELLAKITNTHKKLLKDNKVASDGSPQDSLVVAGDLLPVYGYVYVDLEFAQPVVVPGGESANVSASISSNKSESQDISLLTAVYLPDGKFHSLREASVTCEANSDASLVINSVPLPAGSWLKIFATDGWTSKKNMFDTYMYSDGTVSTYSSSMVVPPEVGTELRADFDRNTRGLTISGAIGSGGQMSGMVYITEKDQTVSAANVIFADVISTDASGKFKLDIVFNTLTWGKDYDVHIISEESPRRVSFTYQDNTQFNESRKPIILADVQASQTWQTMRAVILGRDLDENVINNNFEVINPVMDDYNNLNNKEQVFRNMFSRKAEISVFGDIAALFADVADKCRKAESKKPGGGGGGGGGGSATPPMTTDPIPDTTQTGGAGAYFNDMSGHWAEVYVNTLFKQGVINGYPDGSYEPEGPVTRAELIKIIAGAFGIQGAAAGSFGDVPADAWFAPHVNGAAAAGIVTGFDGLFNPNLPVSRQDAAVMLYRAISLTHALDAGYVFFADEISISAYAAEQISSLAQIGVITGNPQNQFMPLSGLTRGEAAALISRAADYIIAH